jgi:autotransporter-associated beta strand protein
MAHGYDLSGNSIALNAGISAVNNSASAFDDTVNNALLLNSNQTFSVNGVFDTLFLRGPIALNGSGLTFDVASSSEAQVLTVISGAGSLIKTNPGTLLLSSNNTYTGSTTLNGGTLQINGSQPASPVLLNLGTFTGKGTVGTITSTGNGGPGSIMLNPSGTVSILTCSNVSLNAATVYAANLIGVNAGTYNQLNVHGSVALNNATLSVSLGFTPTVGESFLIIANDGADAVTGTFNGLPEGSIFTNSGTVLQITYRGSDGNDVLLTRVNPPAQLTSIAALANSVQLQGAGLSNLTYTIQANTNLTSTNWLVIGSALANGAGSFTFSDTNAPAFSLRFYRAFSP